MAAGLPPPPLNSPNGSYYWLEWYTSLTNALNQTGYPWTSLSFTGSDISDIQTRNHNELTLIQGGDATGISPGDGNAWHLVGKGYVNSAGVASGMPIGWILNNSGAGTYVLSTLTDCPTVGSFGAVATSNTSGVVVEWIDCSAANTVTFHLVAVNTTTPTNGAFTFLVST
jgi:hypothetical protein